MSKLIMSSIAGAVLALATPALAASPDAAVTSGTPDAAQASPKAEQRYCLVYNLTGSHIRRKECKTRKEWLAEGMDPLAEQ